ncbi:UNVERIFIED_CONTAM: hypothetical protein HDU68_010560, partial [Siphonaria sp. JEL0065]
CNSIINSLKTDQIETLKAAEGIKGLPISYIIESLARVDARYIFVCGNPSTIAKVYYSLAKLKRFVGPNYVWISYNILQPVANGTGIYGEKYYQEAKGFIIPSIGNIATNYSLQLYSSMVNTVNQIYSLHFTPEIVDGYTNLALAYDCVNIISTGMNN